MSSEMLSEKPSEAPGDKPTDSALRRRAMDLLARREHSRFELADKLARRFPEAESAQIDSVIERLAEESLQSDERFAESYLYRRRRDGFGWLHIRASLQARGVNDAIIAAIAPPDVDTESIGLAREALARKMSPDEVEAGIVPRGKAHQRLFRFLTNRGFPPEIAHRVLHEHLSQT